MAAWNVKVTPCRDWSKLSGGHMAAKMTAEGLVDAALVMVMGLQPKLIDKLARFKPPLYLAPMPRDHCTLKRNRENFQALVAAKYNENTTGYSQSSWRRSSHLGRNVLCSTSRDDRLLFGRTSSWNEPKVRHGHD